MTRRKPAYPAAYLIDGQRFAASTPSPGLYIVATPIGNLGDITVRALQILAGCNRIACEDTRTTRRLLNRFGIETPMTTYHDHSVAMVRQRLVDRLNAGETIALVSDAGTSRSRGDPHTRPVFANGSALRQRTADRCVFLCRVSASEDGGAENPVAGIGEHPGNACRP
jgi:hypothetical protein